MLWRSRLAVARASQHGRKAVEDGRDSQGRVRGLACGLPRRASPVGEVGGSKPQFLALGSGEVAALNARKKRTQSWRRFATMRAPPVSKRNGNGRSPRAIIAAYTRRRSAG